MALMTVLSDPKSRGAFMSLISTAQQMTIGVAAVVGGLLVGETASGRLDTYWIAGVFAIAANFVVLSLTPLLGRLEHEATVRQTVEAGSNE
jgi:predicted MFS family arabinose efflux permease